MSPYKIFHIIWSRILFNPTIYYGLTCSLILPFYAMAGGSPETTLIVVNAHSPLSMQIANEYVHMRNIPESHIVLLDDVASMDTISIEDFRKKIWSPIKKFIHSHKLDEEIDIITYSGDFPYAVNFTSDLQAKKLKKNNYRGHIASLTALTYFARRVETGDTGYLEKNYYFRDFAKSETKTATAFGLFPVSKGFRSHYVWSNYDRTLWEPADSLNQYYLSTMLAYTGERGNSFSEIINYLSAAASSDATQPEGHVYLLKNSNIRSKTRQPLFPATLKELSRRKQKGEILTNKSDEQNGILPIAKTDVIGAVVGFHNFDWGKTNSHFLPGAIAESLSSYNGDFNKAQQTKLTEFLRYGAAGSSGAVTEPYAFQEKFPVPLIHAWYADGCSLAEAFYQSIKIPYQLLIVGDPLARPFSSFADIKLKSPQLLDPWSGIVAIEADIKPAPEKSVKTMEFWVDGQYLFDVPANKPFSWDTRTIEDGSHDIRLIAIEDSNIETRSSTSFIAQVYNNLHRISIKPIREKTSYDDTIKISGSAPGAKQVELMRGYHKLGTSMVKDSQWQMSIPARAFGIGPVSFFIRASYLDGKTVRSAPVEHLITLPDNALPPVMSKRPSSSGLTAIVHDKKGNEHSLVIKQLNGVFEELLKNKLQAEKLKLNGFFHIANPGFYQFGVLTNGHFRLSVNDQLLLDEHLSRKKGNAFVPVNLKQGWYRLEISLDFSGKQFLKVVLAGDQVPSTLSGDNLGHH